MEMSMQTVDTIENYTAPERPTIFGMRSSALLEIIIALAVLLVIDTVMLDRTRFWDFNPHPFWFVVLFIACKYGTKEAVVAALACSAALLIGNLPHQAVGQDGYEYML